MKVGRGDVGQIGGPDHPHPQASDPTAGRRQVRDLEYRHVPAVTAPPLEVPAGGRVRLRGRHHLHERVAHRKHRVGQAEPAHPRIVKRRRPAERPAQLARHLAAVARHQGHLAQARSAQHTPTIRRPDPARQDRRCGRAIPGEQVIRRVLVIAVLALGAEACDYDS